MSGMIGYALGYDAGRSDEQTANHQREVVHQIFTANGLSPLISRISIGFTRRWLTRAAPQIHNYNASNQWEAQGPAVQKRGAVLAGREVRPRKS